MMEKVSTSNPSPTHARQSPAVLSWSETDTVPSLDPAPQIADVESELLGFDVGYPGTGTVAAHSLKTAPVFTGDALAVAGTSVFPQRALYGQVLSQHSSNLLRTPESSKIYINSNSPFSALICGVQGSGKSHSTSVILESLLIRDDRLGTLPAPIGALMFHFDTAAGGGSVQPCEAAYLASLSTDRAGSATPPGVTVLVLPTSLTQMRRVYVGLPNVRVEPLHFAAEDISGPRLLAMMKVDSTERMPLYMERIMNILRSMDSENFSYAQFHKELLAEKFDPVQKRMLNIRLALLDSCLKGGSASNSVSGYFCEGHLTIIDLSSPFMDANSACGFFDLILGLFVETRGINSGKLVVLDEAHKYLNNGDLRLTESLLTIIRQQRHLNMRVVISTQEPMIVPSKFLDLCSIIIAHRFSSLSWLTHLVAHMCTPQEMVHELFSEIISLGTGQALMFAPSGVSTSNHLGTIVPVGAGYLKVRSRLRITQDGGHSILAVADADFTTRVRPRDAPIPHSTTISPNSSTLSPIAATAISKPSHVSQHAAEPSNKAPISSATQGVVAIPPAYVPLLKLLRQTPPSGGVDWRWSSLGSAMPHPRPYTPGKMLSFLKEAQMAGLVSVDMQRKVVRLAANIPCVPS